VISSLVPALAVAVVAGGRQPDTALLAAAPTQSGTAVAGASLPPVAVPDRPRLPAATSMRAPASISPSGARVGQTSVQSIPDAALAAYQQATGVIDTADLSCHLDWTLLAAIGQVESDQGRVGGSHLDRHGVARPRIIGPRLDGRHGTALVRDTDAGRLDHDRHYDHAVGPMQFLPSTWAVVAVDGDGDGRRNVQDINDAALGSAVYLCAGHGDLATRSGDRAALNRYNHSAAYVRTVLEIARGLRIGSLFTPVTPAGTVSTDLVPVRPHPTDGHTTTADPPDPIVITDPVPPSAPTASPTAGPTQKPTTSPSPTPSESPTAGPSPSSSPSPTTDPTTDPTASPTSPMPSGTPTPSEPTSTPTGTPTASPTATPEPPVIPDPVPAALTDLTRAQVRAFDAAWPACVLRLPDPWTRHDVRRILARDLGLPRHDHGLRVFAHWVTRHEHRHPSVPIG
jgi:membrane-bound lytic murein transglycosylase B